MKVKFLLTAAALLTVSIGSSANAAVTISFDEVGSNVVSNVSGMLNLTGMKQGGNLSLASGLNSQFAVFSATAGNGTDYVGLSGPANFGTVSGAFVLASSSSGDVFRLSGFQNAVTVPLNYVSGSMISASSTFVGRNFASLGLTPGSYVYSLPADTITVRVGSIAAATVPEPATWMMLMLGMAGVGFSLRRKNKQTLRVRYT